MQGEVARFEHLRHRHTAALVMSALKGMGGQSNVSLNFHAIRQWCPSWYCKRRRSHQGTVAIAGGHTEKEVRQIFDAVDTDGNGVLSAGECTRHGRHSFRQAIGISVA